MFALATAVVAPAAASAATRLGPDLTTPPSGFFAAVGCQPGQYSPCSYVNLHSTSAALPVAAPTDGVITRWRFRAGMNPEAADRAMTLRTFRPGTQDGSFGYSFIIPGAEGPAFVIPAGNQVLSDPPVELPARMPIEAGERVGIVAENPISLAVYDPTPGVTWTVVANGTVYNGEPYGVTYSGTALAINADLEPDGDGDGYGDETQDCDPSDPAVHDGGCVPPSPPSTPPSPPPVFVPGGGCTGVCGGGGSVSVPSFSGAIQPAPSGDGSKIYVPLKCPPTATSPCGGFLIVTQAKPKRGAVELRELARKAYDVAVGETAKLRVRLSKRARKLLERKGRLEVEITIDPNEGEPVSARKTLRWRGSRGH